ncbi:MAG: glycyl-radical enzyme activating protein [Candidatus Korarchaeota archaeon]|nr:glycyl-radical enzyme activating protein [Candidatus Korarchaeota archaeon]NIU84083.1 glycyl-radical enzyme activating protein [Candidatus Thorarchaeota archaeon]NIW14222.1 glycyl-radical enzyme activating protein [Candidatus Thorarchaeota archaeon]NIW52319.1 glycyl-radical enzyme activating protein [Candidatus Korarchaeota archaeon]
MNEERGSIFDIKRFAIHDGSGIRTTVFLKGCPLHCWWCHNPEGLSPKKEVVYYEYKCMNCGNCIEACPHDAITATENGRKISQERCTSCGVCVEVCPTDALQMIGREISVEELMEEIEKDLLYYDTSGGGVTFSGGEPLMQPDFLMACLEACKEADIHTALDTSGYAPPEIFDSVIGDVDLFLFDLKLLDDEQHRTYTGVSNKVIKRNLRSLSAKGRGEDVILRFPVIPGITDTETNITALITFVSSLSGIHEIDLLPFHNVGEKYERMRRLSRMGKRSSPSKDRIRNLVEKIKINTSLSVKVGGR